MTCLSRTNPGEGEVDAQRIQDGLDECVREGKACATCAKTIQDYGTCLIDAINADAADGGDETPDGGDEAPDGGDEAPEPPAVEDLRREEPEQPVDAKMQRAMSCDHGDLAECMAGETGDCMTCISEANGRPEDVSAQRVHDLLAKCVGEGKACVVCATQLQGYSNCLIEALAEDTTDGGDGTPESHAGEGHHEEPEQPVNAEVE